MDILITEKILRKFLQTDTDLESITTALCESGPTVDRVHKLDNDNLLEIEVITNRIDCASAFGIAREANTILNQKGIKSQLINDPYKTKPLNNHQTQKINLTIYNKSFAKRFLSVSIDSVNITESDQETQELLKQVGQRPINNLVDLTNVATLLYGIPSHIFDKDKLSLAKLDLREAKKGESMKLLDDTKIDLQNGDLIIEDGNKNIVDLCGVMGGQFAQVDNHTKNILLIVPVYHPQKIRSTSLFHQKRTIAAQIFEKNPDPSLAPSVLTLIANKITEIAGGHLSSTVLDIDNTSKTSKSIDLNINWLSKFIGQSLSASEAKQILNNLDFLTTESEGGLSVTVPEFRQEDINDKEDLAEEVARIYGYHNIKPVFPVLKSGGSISGSIFNLERKIRNVLSSLQYNEVINISLISQKQILDCGLKPQEHLQLKNALSEDLSFMRISLVPNTLQNHKNNKGYSAGNLSFFEIGNIYLSESEESVKEIPHLVFSNNFGLIELKNDLNKLFSLLNLSNQVSFVEAASRPTYFDEINTAKIIIDDIDLGFVGEIKKQTTINFNLDKPVFVCELNLEQLNSIKPKITYQPISIYPAVLEDINLQSDLSLGEIYSTIKKTSDLIYKIDYLNSFENKHTFRLHFISQDKNLTQEETAKIKQQILKNFS